MTHRLLLIGKGAVPEATRSLLEGTGYRVDMASLGDPSVAELNEYQFIYSLILIDLDSAELERVETARFVALNHRTLTVLIHSSNPSRDALLSMWKSGAAEFIERGDGSDLRRAVGHWCTKYERTHSTLSVSTDSEESVKAIAAIGMVGRSAAMHRLANEVERYRNKAMNVLILGESGTGKEKVAMALHPNPALPFLAVNCASYNGDTALMEAELFGAERGAYTGATTSRKGIFCEANGGTILLDEIHTLCLSAQQKLLRVLQEKKIRPLGSAREVLVCFRLIVAAKPNLEELVRLGAFLPDLFFRLHVLRLDIPPLRERPEDIELLVDFFCRRYCEANEEKKVFLAQTVRRMERYSWPGNIRELENAVGRLCASTVEEQITPEHLDHVIYTRSRPPLPHTAHTSYRTEMERVTCQRITEALRGNVTMRQAARQLGIPHSTFHGLLQRFGITSPRTTTKPCGPRPVWPRPKTELLPASGIPSLFGTPGRKADEGGPADLIVPALQRSTTGRYGR